MPVAPYLFTSFQKAPKKNCKGMHQEKTFCFGGYSGHPPNQNCFFLEFFSSFPNETQKSWKQNQTCFYLRWKDVGMFYIWSNDLKSIWKVGRQAVIGLAQFLRRPQKAGMMNWWWLTFKQRRQWEWYSHYIFCTATSIICDGISWSN